MSEPAIAIESVDVVYRLAHSRRVSIKEFARDWIGGALSYSEFNALQNVSLSIAPRESVAIIGSNGAGKSTLLKVIAGALQPTRGTCRVRGRLSVVLDSGTCFDRELTGVENIYLAGLLLGRSRVEVAAALPGIVATSDIGDFIDSPMRIYSSGMSARLSFAVSMAWPVDFLLTDESLAVGDAAFRERCWSRLHELQRQGQAIVAVSHDPKTVIDLCDRAVWIDQGRLIADGPSREVLERYERSGGSAERDSDASVARAATLALGAAPPGAESGEAVPASTADSVPPELPDEDATFDSPIEPENETEPEAGRIQPTPNQAAVWFHVSDVASTAEWYVSIGFTLRATSDHNGWISFATLECGGTQIMLSHSRNAGRAGRQGPGLYVFTQDVGAVFERLKDLVEVEEGLHEAPYEMREFTIRDLNETKITFGQPIPNR